MPSLDALGSVAGAVLRRSSSRCGLVGTVGHTGIEDGVVLGSGRAFAADGLCAGAEHGRCAGVCAGGLLDHRRAP